MMVTVRAISRESSFARLLRVPYNVSPVVFDQNEPWRLSAVDFRRSPRLQ
jgi:hypothetical protein